jgi:hypothetical protein
MGVLGQRSRDACHAAAVALRQHLLDGELGYEDEPFQVGGDEAAKLVGGVLGNPKGSLAATTRLA